MLPIYEATDVLEIISEKAGHTKPWVVLADTPDGVKPFVTKLYTTGQVDQFHCITNEVVCNLLAGEFDLKVPGCALIDIPVSLSLKLNFEAQLQYENADPRLKFATSLLDGSIIADQSLSKKIFMERIPLDTLYAFDNLIRNRDRGTRKTNLLLHQASAYLIDHELAFDIHDIVDIDVNKLYLEDKFTKYHLFFQHLKRTNKLNSQFFFNDFLEYLKMMNTNKLNPYFAQLINEGFDDYSPHILYWLNHIKQNSTTFVNSLKASL